MLDRSCTVPLYLQIRDILRSEILEKPYQEGETFYGEIELAERFQVARGTVRQALAALEQDGFISRERGRGTFVTTRKTVAHDRSSSPTIAFIVPHCRDSYVPTMLLGVEAAARERGAHVLFRHVESSPHLQSEALRSVRGYGVAGVLLFPVDAMYQDPALLDLLAERFPVVLVDRYIPGLDLDYVVSDGFGGTLRATQHLLGLGHSRIGFVTWDVHHAGQAGRLLGYQQALREWGIEPTSDLVCQLKEYPADDLSPLIEFLSRPDRPTAVLTLNDYLAVKVARICRELRLRIPEQLALIGFDDTDVASQMEVPLTTVCQPIHELGAQATRLLLNKIAGHNHQPQRLILPTHLAVRESCGAHLASR